VAGHQKIRFRRGEIAELGSLPSARDGHGGRDLHFVGRVVGFAALSLAVFFVVLAGVLAASGSLVVSSDGLKREAEKAASAMLGTEVALLSGEARITFGFASPLGFELRDVVLGDAATGERRLEAEFLRFGVRALPLLRGDVRLASATLSGARAAFGALPDAGDEPGMLAAISGEDGMLGGDEIVPAVFSALRAALGALDGTGTGRFVVENVDLDIGAGASPLRLRIDRAELAEQGDGGAGLSVSGELGGRTIDVAGTLTRATDGGLSLALTLDMPTPDNPAEPVLDEHDLPPAVMIGSVSARLSGSAPAAANGGTLQARVEVADSALRVGRSPQHRGRVAAELSLDGRRQHIEIVRLEAGDGRTDLQLSGRLGPATGEGSPHYFLQLASGGSMLAPAESAESGLPVAIFANGRIEADLTRIAVDRLVIATGQSEVLASGAVDLPKSGGAGLTLAIDVANLPTSHAKNIWPWFAAYPARKWTLTNVYGGVVRKGSLRIELPPGRMGDGVPLTPKDLTGHFEVHGARFDMAGSIPPMRDAVGLVDISGKDVKIGLVSGTVFTESGRSLTARDGTFTINDTHLPHLVGKLSLDVQGSADAVAEIANYDPINLSRYLSLDPQGMAGEVWGHVDASVPLVAGSAGETLDWKVDLAYSGLAVPQGFEGQKLTEGVGTIYADPTKAIIEAKGLLNGVPADFSLEEPLGRDKSGRRMIAELQVNDASRDALMPGLSSIVSGPFSLTLISRGDGASDITADLTRARLQVPWIGWEKKPGTAGSASFVMRSKDGTTEISEFSATGSGFSAAGALSIDGQGFQSADFSRLALRPGDDFAARVERRAAGGLAVRVRGRSADVRTVVGQFNLDSRDGDGGWGATDDISVDLELASATGHHGEKLRDLKLIFSGPGTTVGGLRASAITASGAPVSMVDSTIGKERRLEMVAGNAGEVLRFLNIYENVRGGSAELRLSGTVGKAMSGPLLVRNFELVEEQRLDTVVNRAAPGSRQSLNDTVNRAVDVSRARFEVGYAVIEKGEGYLNVADGLVRGSSIGATFQGTVFDRSGNMLVTGTFMPAYGLNRLFGEIPLLGLVLGNGRDRGLIGITFRLHGKASDPQVSMNPLSIIAPGIFRQIFEYQPKQMDTGE
jgi:hypothetical protein